MRSETAVLTTIFPQVLPYLPRLVESLLAQSLNEFDLIVINDGVTEVTLQGLFGEKLNWVNLPMEGMRPNANRWAGIQYCLEKGYRYILFQDADDWMSANRLEDAVSVLEKENVVFTDLNLVDQTNQLIHSQIWTSRFTSSKIDVSFLEDKNCIGLGNAAVRTSCIPKSLSIPESIIAVDWFIFYHVLMSTGACFTNQSQVYYRQHTSNTAGIDQLSEARVKNTIRVKKVHYSNLMQTFPALLKENEKLLLFEEQVNNKPEFLNEYLLTNKNKGTSSFWWEETNFNYETD